MNSRSLLRDLALLAFAATLGWWARSANSAVHADSAHASDPGLSFQFGGGAGLNGALSLYNPANRTLYVYPSAVNNDHINCAYSFYIERPGAPIERSNCPMGTLTNH